MAGIKEPSSRYHVSREKFLPTMTSYVYGHAIGAELKSRLDRVLKIYLEYGIEDVQSRIKPRIAFRTIRGSDDVYFCTQKKDIEDESFPTNVSLKVLRKTILLSGFFSFVATIVLVLEMFMNLVRSKLAKVAKERSNQKSRPRARDPFKTRDTVIFRKQVFEGQWQPCQVIRIEIKKVTPILGGTQFYARR